MQNSSQEYRIKTVLHFCIFDLNETSSIDSLGPNTPFSIIGFSIQDFVLNSPKIFILRRDFLLFGKKIGTWNLFSIQLQLQKHDFDKL